ncbi:hypothetical protein MAPG_00072, partial [Magnaporthiopsis poae ATCC 64411]
MQFRTCFKSASNHARSGAKGKGSKKGYRDWRLVGEFSISNLHDQGAPGRWARKEQKHWQVHIFDLPSLGSATTDSNRQKNKRQTGSPSPCLSPPMIHGRTRVTEYRHGNPKENESRRTQLPSRLAAVVRGGCHGSGRSMTPAKQPSTRQREISVGVAFACPPACSHNRRRPQDSRRQAGGRHGASWRELETDILCGRHTSPEVRTVQYRAGRRGSKCIHRSLIPRRGVRANWLFWQCADGHEKKTYNIYSVASKTVFESLPRKKK